MQAKLAGIEEVLKKKVWVTFPDLLTDGLLITDFRSPKENSKRNSKSGQLASGYDPTWLNKTKHGSSKDRTPAISGFTDAKMSIGDLLNNVIKFIYYTQVSMRLIKPKTKGGLVHAMQSNGPHTSDSH